VLEDINHGDMLALSPCHLYTHIRGRTLWILG
jgi:hypothetical protein